MNAYRQIFCFALALMILIGCATSKEVWSNRVGHFTYDQAVAELGTPDNVDMLKDGAITADWYTHRDSARSLNPGKEVSSAPEGAGLGAPVSSAGARTLRLTFDRDRILRSWTR